MQKFVIAHFNSIQPNEAEILMAELAELGFYAFEQNENELKAYCAQEDFSNNWEHLIPEKINFNIEIVANKNWNAEWERTFQPVIVGEFAAIRANFHAPISSVKHELIITPKMSFGTGHHATTYLMMQEMDLLDFEEKRVVDFGTGTGVLAILAEKLGAQKILAIDYDEWSVRNAEENIEANSSKKIDIIQSDKITANWPADIILANINFNVLASAAQQIANILNPGGLLLISGFYTIDGDAIMEIFAAQGIQENHRVDKENWCALLLEKRKTV